MWTSLFLEIKVEEVSQEKYKHGPDGRRTRWRSLLHGKNIG